MKKLILILAVSFFMVQFSDAQMFQWGIKGGLGLSSLKVSDLTGLGSGADAYDLVTGDKVVGYHVGLQTRIKIAMLFVQPELYFNDGGGSVQKVADNGLDGLMTVDFKRIDLPVLVGVKLGPARLGIGPVGSYVVQESVVSDITELGGDDYTVFTNAMTWGFQAGLGVDLSKISIDARYEGSLSKLGESFNVGGVPFELDARPSQWIFSLGFWF
jgi:hypothetical protein